MKPVTPSPLWHFTCSHGVEGITKLRLLHPNPHLLLPGRPSLLWLTDLETPDRDGLGLTSERLSRDRTEYRVRVDATYGARWWPEWARDERVPRQIRDDLETFGRPAHWWVSPIPLPVAAIEPVARERAS